MKKITFKYKGQMTNYYKKAIKNNKTVFCGLIDGAYPVKIINK